MSFFFFACESQKTQPTHKRPCLHTSNLSPPESCDEYSSTVQVAGVPLQKDALLPHHVDRQSDDKRAGLSRVRSLPPITIGSYNDWAVPLYLHFPPSPPPSDTKISHRVWFDTQQTGLKTSSLLCDHAHTPIIGQKQHKRPTSTPWGKWCPRSIGNYTHR